jgi:nucleoid-associated protein YgaU
MEGHLGKALCTQTRSTAVTRFNATITLTLVMVTASLLLVGCQNTKKDVPVSTSVTDVTATPAPAAQPAYTPAPNPAPTPAYASVSDSITPPSSSTGGTGAISGGSYTVKRGDTLYAIARARYGDGKQWRKIVDANPGLQPGALKVGQTIALP